MAKGHKVVHLPATPQRHKGFPFVARQRPYDIGDDEVHVPLKDETSLGTSPAWNGCDRVRDGT